MQNLVFLCWCVAASLMVSAISPILVPAATVATEPVEQLILFVDVASPAMDDLLPSDARQALRELAEEQGIDFRVRVVGDGVPPEVDIVPMLVFQNHRGRSVYQGRYTRRERLQNFLRTARWFPQEAVPLERQNVWVRHDGRATIAVVSKITPLAGTRLPEGVDLAAVEASARSAIGAGLSGFHEVSRAQLSRTDRTFYFDFHPFLAEDGTLFLSTAIFSQFDCDHAIYSQFEAPVTSSWNDRDSAFRRAAAELTDQLDRLRRSSAEGDGFVAVSSDTPVKSWEELGLPQPTPPDQGNTDSARPAPAIRLPLRWELAAQSPSAPPRLQFTFPAPLDSYSGELRSLAGKLLFESSGEATGPAARSLRGNVIVTVNSITMGDEYLDESLLAADTLDAANHPKSSFEVRSVETDPGPIRFGELRTVVLNGTFRMKGIETPLSTRLTLEPLATDQGEPRLRARGRFEIRLENPFGIQGPDGPTPANDTLQFRYDLLFQPAAKP